MTAPNPTDGGNTPSSDNVSPEQFVALRVQPETETAPPEEPELEEQPEAVEDVQPEEPEEIEQAEELGEGEGEAIDLTNLSPEEYRELADKQKSRLMSRMSELTAEIKTLKAKVSEAPKENPLEASAAKPIVENPFSNLDTIESVQEQYAEMQKAAEETERILDEYEDYRADDVIQIGESEMTKAQLKRANRNAREAMTKFLPARFEELQKAESWKAQEEQFRTQLRQEIPEFADDSTELSKALGQIIEDPLVQKLKEAVPEIAPSLERLLGHATRSMFQMGSMKSNPPKVPTPSKPSPPTSPTGSAGAKARPSGSSKAIAEAKARYDQSGDPDAWVAARALELANR